MKKKMVGTRPEMPENPFIRSTYDAVLFDLDGVVTATAKIHSACWKKTFDEFLENRAKTTGAPFVPFREPEDYLDHVDGKPRLAGVRDFLLSRGVELPEGQTDAPTGEESIHGLANGKNQMFKASIKKQPPDIYETSLDLARRLARSGFRVAVVSSSRNCVAVMKSAGIENLFEVTVDGVRAAEKNLRGKPEPDTFVEAARLLGTEPGRSVVIEDASSGVRAGRKGGFGLVIGVARKNNEEELLRDGADMVVADLGEFKPGD